MKRFLSALLAVVMIVMMIVPVSAADTTVTVTASKATANVGDEIVFTVNVKNAANVSAISVIPQYDKDAFEMVSGSVPKATKVEFVMEDANFIDGGFDLATNLWAGMFEPAYTLADIDIFTFTLKAKKTAKASTVTCTLPSFVDTDSNPIANTVTATTVSVVCEHTFGGWEKHNADQHKQTCSACGEVAYEAHKWDDGTVATKPTHLTVGEKTYTCAVCGEKKSEEIAKTTDHTFGAWEKHNAEQHKHTCECGKVEYEAHKWDAGEVTKAPTCKEEGVKTYTCSVCDETKTESIAKTTDHKYGDWTKDTADQHKHTCEVCGKTETAAHKWNAGEITKPASHVATGIRTYTCTECGETKTETLPKTEGHGFGAWEKHNAEQHKHTCECGEVEYEAHKWNAGEVTKAPTCKEEGVKTYTCTVCGETKTESIAKTTDHKYGDWTKDTADRHKHTCEVCGKSETAAHKWNAGEITKPASHVATGIKTYTCTECGETKTETLPKTEGHGFGAWEKHNAEQHKHTCECGKVEYEAHKWNAGEVTKAPTCKEEGVKTYTCTVCGETKTESIAKTTDHKYGTWTKDTADRHKHTCEVCGKTETAAHKWNAGEITKPASHVATGVKTYTCTECGETKTETLPKTEGHGFGAWEKHNAEQHKHSCECGKVEYEAHKWNAGEITKPASHVATGIKTYTCTECGETKTETLPKTTDHGFGAWEKHNAEQHKHSCECGEIEYANHKWNAGEITKPASHVATGIKTYTCTECGETKTETLPKTEGHGFGAWEKHNAEQHKHFCECGEIEYANHKWNAGEITKPASHVATGIKTYTCTECGETKTETLPKTEGHGFGAWEKHNAEQHKHSCECGEIEYANHTWNAGEVTKAPTCKDTGIKTYTCTACGETKTETLAKTTDHKYSDWTKDTADQHKHTCEVCGKTESADHTWNAGEVTKAPTCKDTGIKTYTCTACGETKTETLAKTTDHKWDSGKVTAEPTCKDTGVKTYTCTVCDKTRTETVPTTTAHTWGAWHKNNANVHTHDCAVCGKTENRSHEWDKGVITVQPSAGKDGEMLYTCTVCGETKTVVLSASHECNFGSDYKYSDSFHWQECSICLSKKNTKAHTWDNGNVITPATHTAAGKIEYACTVCDMTKTEALPLITEHTYSAWTAHNDSIHARTCECGDIEYAAHNFGAWTVVTEATSDAEGLEKHTCEDCGKTVERTIAKLPAPVTKNEYKVTFHNVYGASDSEYQMTVNTGKPIVFDIEMTREGYTFGGWYQDEACTVAFDISAGKNDTVALELYARWIENEKAVTIVIEGATPINTVGAVIAGERIQAPIVSLKEGEKVEWYADADFTIPFDFDNDVDYVASMTLYAKIVKDDAGETEGSSATESTETTATENSETTTTGDSATPIVPIIVVIVIILGIGIIVTVVVIKKKKA